MIAWDDDLIQAIGRRRSVIVLGSGVSRNSMSSLGKRPDTWDIFLRAASTNIGNPAPLVDLINQKDFLTACDVIKNKIGQQDFLALIRKEYHRPGYIAADIHKHIYDLDSSIVISPNFDNIYETYASSVSAGTLITKDHTSDDLINYLAGGDTRVFIKTHGSANTPGHVIFTRADYAEARTKYVLFYEVMKSLVLTHRFLFLGCGVDDPDIRSMFEDVRFAHEHMPYHYMTTPAGEIHPEVRTVIGETMKIRFLEYSPAAGHQELTDSLKDLATKVDAFRDQRAIDRKW